MFIRRASAITIVFVALALAGCGGGSDGAAGDHTTTSAPRSTTTVAPTTTTTVPPPYSFDNSVPPPKLINTGTDYASIYRSLSNYARWAESHNPDPALAKRVYVVGTKTYEGYESDLNILSTSNLRLVNVGRTLDVAVVSVRPTLVALRLTESVEEMRLVRPDGTIKDHQTSSRPLLWNALISRDEIGRWHIASVESADETTQVRL